MEESISCHIGSGVCVVWFLNSDLKHIEDTNGSEDYSIATITDEQIIDMSIGALGGPNRSTGTISLRLVGESAAFTIQMDEIEYDLHSHLD